MPKIEETKTVCTLINNFSGSVIYVMGEIRSTLNNFNAKLYYFCRELFIWFLMRIRCPYCDCRYDIHPDTLSNPVGHERLGFGWWLRCYQCQKKFWLKSTTVINTGFSPIKADSANTIRRISNFSHRKVKSNKRNYTAYILIILTIIGYVCYANMGYIRNFFITKMNHFTAFAATNLQLSNIIYRIDKIDKKYRVAIMGNIENKTNTIMSYNGVRILLLSGSLEFASWTYEPDVKSVIPGEKVVFNTDRLLDTAPSNIRVLVRIV